MNGKPATTVQVWKPGMTAATVSFDKESKLLVKVTYEGRESEKPVTKEVTFLSHKEIDGIKYGDASTLKTDGTLFFDGHLTRLETPPSIDPKLFKDP